jgi:hypothetical protein
MYFALMSNMVYHFLVYKVLFVHFVFDTQIIYTKRKCTNSKTGVFICKTHLQSGQAKCYTGESSLG